MEGIITDIKRFAVHDGDGIRTTVFLKGCPLRCLWCHNPEAVDFEKSIAFFAHSCADCGDCAGICPANTFDGAHHFTYEKCTVCGQCADLCPNGALKLYGKTVTSEEVFSVLREDIPFYAESGGGITLSGGECLCQSGFCRELLQKCRSLGINTAVDTCGFVSREAIEAVLPFTDTFLYDIKAIDEEVHIRCTGVSNKRILENLRYLDDAGADIEVRIPYVPGFNDDQIGRIGAFLQGFRRIKKVRVLPYHALAGSKYTALHRKNTLPQILPRKEEIREAERVLASFSLTVAVDR